MKNTKNLHVHSNPINSMWYWQYEGVDMYLEVGEKIRVRVVVVEFGKDKTGDVYEPPMKVYV
jgi:DNA-directed RNA polymerase subunit E'/Rpb7